jgi:hypothetical protein
VIDPDIGIIGVGLAETQFERLEPGRVRVQ